MFAQLHNFKGIFLKLVTLSASTCTESTATGADAEPAATRAEEKLQFYSNLLHQMARSSPHQLTLVNLDLSEIDLKHFKSFQNTRFYTSYCKHFISNLKEAHDVD